MNMNKMLRGEYAWLVLFFGILLYDSIAIKTRKAETMSNAVWRSLEHPVKSPVAAGIWLTLTYHLFLDKRARKHWRQLFNNILDT